MKVTPATMKHCSVEEKSDPVPENKAGRNDTHSNHSRRLPAIRTAGLQCEDKARHGAEGEACANPVHAHRLAEDVARRASVRVRTERQRSLDEEQRGDDADGTDGKVDL